MPRRRPQTQADGLQILGRRVRQLREDRGWAQVDLAAHIDDVVQRAMISDIETGRRAPSLATLARIAAAFDVPIASLFLDPETGLQHRVAARALEASTSALRPVAKLLDVDP